jgi:hypothetical protein
MPGHRAERLRAGAERWRVGRSAGENAEHRRRIESREPADERRAHGAENHDRRGQRVHFHPLLPQRGEEARPELQPDREDEQNQPEFLHEIERVMIHRRAKVSDENAREQDPRRAEPDTAKLELPKAIPSTQTNASMPIACAIGWAWLSSESQFMRQA